MSATKCCFLVLLIVVVTIMNHARAQCYLDGSPGLLLDPYIDPQTGQIGCRDGFICPGLDPLNTSTYPVYCPPSPKCYLDRMWADECEPQGEFEPYICPAKHYCPNSSVIVFCPEGHFCPGGTRTPHKCWALSICPAGTRSQRFYGSVVILIIWSVVYIAVVLLYRKFFLLSDISLQNDESESPQEALNTSSRHREQWAKELVDGFRRARGTSSPLHVLFANLGVHIVLPDGSKKILLENVTGEMRPGTVTAIMGPSGCGKSVFLATLLARAEDTWKLSGKLTINRSEPAKFKNSIGYVPQEDVLHRDLSLAKNLYYSSEIRLPQHWTHEQRHLFRSAVIHCLEMAPHRDLPIGDEEEGGLSGGQRKRTSIAIELVAAPMALFLDAPTSGLDANTALELCHLLRRVAQQTELTIAMIMQQPRVEIWEALDQVLFMGPGGRIAYQGPQCNAQSYFSQFCQIQFTPECNPADVIVDEIAKRGEEITRLWEEYVALHADENSAAGPKSNSPQLANDGNGASSSELVQHPPYGAESEEVHYGASFMMQVLLCHNRYIEKQMARISSFALEIFLVALCGAVLGQSLMDYHLKGVYKRPYDRLSPLPWPKMLPELHMYALASLGLAAAAAGTRVFSSDHATRRREATTGHNFAADFIGTVLATPYRVAFCSFVYCVGYHFVASLDISFFDLWSVLLPVYWTTYGMSFLVSSIADPRIAPTIALVLSIAVCVFNGRIGFPLFMKYLSFAFWGSQILHNKHHEGVKHIYQETLSEAGYKEGQTGLSFAMIIIWAFIFQVAAFAFLNHRYRVSARP